MQIIWDITVWKDFTVKSRTARLTAAVSQPLPWSDASAEGSLCLAAVQPAKTPHCWPFIAHSGPHKLAVRYFQVKRSQKRPNTCSWEHHRWRFWCRSIQNYIPCMSAYIHPVHEFGTPYNIDGLCLDKSYTFLLGIYVCRHCICIT